MGKHLIPRFRDLVVVGGSPKSDALVVALDERVQPPWSRDHEAEDDRVLAGRGYGVYHREAGPDGPGLRLFLLPQGDNVEVVNVVPSASGSLTHDEYNQAVAQFYDDYLGEACASLGLTAELGPVHYDLEKDLPAKVYQALSAFSGAANKSTGSSHPMDRERWYEFIWRAHESGCDLDPTVLGQWFEADGWESDEARELAIEFESGRGLLRHRGRTSSIDW